MRLKACEVRAMKLRKFFSKAKTKLLTLGLTLTAFIPAVLAEEASTTVAGLDVQSLVNLVMSIVPLIIVLVIVRAILDAFGRLG